MLAYISSVCDIAYNRSLTRLFLPLTEVSSVKQYSFYLAWIVKLLYSSKNKTHSKSKTLMHQQ